jgi:hypothetical protein
MDQLKVSEANQEDIAVWKNLEKYPAWKRVVRELQERIKSADEIINTIGFDREKMFSERDVAIIKKNAYLDLIDMPSKNIDLLSGTGNLPVEELDAFAHPDDLDDEL